MHYYDISNKIDTSQNHCEEPDKIFKTINVHDKAFNTEVDVDTGLKYTFLSRDHFAKQYLNKPLPLKI